MDGVRSHAFAARLAAFVASDGQDLRAHSGPDFGPLVVAVPGAARGPFRSGLLAAVQATAEFQHPRVNRYRFIE